MPPQTTAAGDRLNELVFNDANDSYPIGGVITGAAAGQSSGARFIEGPKSANRTIPNPENTIVTGEDGELLHQYDWNSTGSREFTAEFSVEDLYLAGLIQNVPTNSWLSGQYSYADIQSAYVPNVLAIFQRRSKRISDGGSVWSGEILLNCTVRYLGSAGFTERGAAVYRYSLTPQPSSWNQLGFTLFDNNGQQKAARSVPFQGLTHPITVAAIKGNGSATQFSLDRPPIDVSRVSAVVERAAATIASVVTSAPYSATFASAPASGKRGLVWYEFAE